MKNLVIIVLCFFFLNALSQGRQKVIIDTDCAIDDFRAINFLLSVPEIEICAVITSEGSLTSQEGAEKMKTLLKEWNADSIPVIKGKEINGPAPAWRSFNKKISWGKPISDKNYNSFEILKSFSGDNSPYTLVCLGTLTSAAEIKDHYPAVFNNLGRIVWYNNSVYPPNGFNYNYDKQSADNFLKNAPIRIDVVSNLGDSAMRVYPEFIQPKSDQTVLTKNLSFIHSQHEVSRKLNEGHFYFADDLVAVYLLNPELFDMTIKMSEPRVRFTKTYNRDAIKEVISDIITNKYIYEKNIVFNEFPAKKEFFNYDVRQIIDTVIARYGYEEWKACVITDEFHGHLGVFSIVGAKMGIKAREIFNVGTDQLTVESFAGLIPPYSCMNDGIQVSTGATLGQGTIRVSYESIKKPEAIFTFKGRSVKLTLKQEYLDIVNNDISEGIVKFGLTDDGYWKMVRQSALRYWTEWSRDEIFEITEL